MATNYTKNGKEKSSMPMNKQNKSKRDFFKFLSWLPQRISFGFVLLSMFLIFFGIFVRFLCVHESDWQHVFVEKKAAHSFNTIRPSMIITEADITETHVISIKIVDAFGKTVLLFPTDSICLNGDCRQIKDVRRHSNYKAFIKSLKECNDVTVKDRTNKK